LGFIVRLLKNFWKIHRISGEIILEHFEPSPPTNFTGRAWIEILKPAKFFLARARPEILFLVVLDYKIRERPTQARPEN
jgi:hypothetical protein